MSTPSPSNPPRIVHVVAFRPLPSQGGGVGGFDWFLTHELAVARYNEVKVAAEHQDDEVALFDLAVEATEREAITTEIDAQLDELMDSFKLIRPTETQSARVRRVYSDGSDTHGEHPFSPLSFHEDHEADLAASIEKGELVPVVDERAGGIIAYATSEEHADRVAGLLNAAASEQVEPSRAVANLFASMPIPPDDMGSPEGLAAYAEAIAQWRKDCGHPIPYDGPVGPTVTD